MSEHLKEEVGKKFAVNYYPTSGDGASNQRFYDGVSCCLEIGWGDSNEGKEDFRRRFCPDGLKPHIIWVGGFKSSPRAAVWMAAFQPLLPCFCRSRVAWSQ